MYTFIPIEIFHFSFQANGVITSYKKHLILWAWSKTY